MRKQITYRLYSIRILFTIAIFLNNSHRFNAVKITLFDSTQVKDDLNWSKISFKESSLPSDDENNSNNWLNDKLNANNDIYGWKESSFSPLNGDNVWRIHFVCDLNVQNIQNWLFTPLINTKLAKRVSLNLTFTIRECEQFPIKQVVKNCREKFELYYEEKTLKPDQINKDQSNSSLYFLNKIKQLRFRDTFVSDSGLRYYNSVVDRQKQLNRNSNKPGESSINVELREIPLSTSIGSNEDSFVRFAIRDTGACISLLSVEVSYVTCSAFTKHGITFPETSTGRDLTDLIQVNGDCPKYSTSIQIPKAICTAKGEWLITDQNLADRCQCLPGYEFDKDQCIPCQIGFYKDTTSNELKCSRCPLNSWSSKLGSFECNCLNDFYRENDFNPSKECKPIQPIITKDLNFDFINEEKINISINRAKLAELISSNIRSDIRCYVCSQTNMVSEECNAECFISSSSNDWIVLLNNKNLKKNLKYKILINQKLMSGKDLTSSAVYLYLDQRVYNPNSNSFLPIGRTTERVTCKTFYKNDLNHHTNQHVKYFCLNMTINLNEEFKQIYPNQNLKNKLKLLGDFNFRVYASVVNNDFQLIPNNVHTNRNVMFKQTNYIQLNSLENISVEKLILEDAPLPIYFCNSLDIESLKFEFSFKSIGQKFQINTNYQTYENNKLELYAIDFSLANVCTRKKVDLLESLQYFSNQPVLAETTNTKLFEGEFGTDVNSTQSLKVHVILPIILSSFFVTFFILVAIFFRRLRFNTCNERNYTCEKHIKRFIPGLSKSCSNKCINCSTNSSANSSSSSSTTSSSSPSTVCTTSQIIERNSKLYYVDPHTYEDPAIAIQEFAQEIAPLDIKIESVIGGGEFGDVCKGKLKNTNNAWTTVAIKTLKVGSSEKNRCDFLTEASIMAQFHHENIICLEGVVTQTNPYMIITEYMENGSLDTFLRLNSWRLNIYDLVKMLKDIANGMKYLAEMNFVHRDLAARNILVNKSLKCKVADFGLSREIEGTTTEGVYWTKGGKIPVRWTAPEAISHTKFTCSSDVWSFGVVAWEVMSYGERPYWNWSNTDVIKAVDKGFRLLQPPNCPQVLYNMMLDCWNANRLHRPRFKQILSDLEVLVKSKKENLYSTPKNSKHVSFIDTNRPNFSQLTSIQEWLNSLNLTEYENFFLNRNYLNLSQVLNFDKSDLESIKIMEEITQNIILESLKCIQFELNFQNGFLV